MVWSLVFTCHRAGRCTPLELVGRRAHQPALLGKFAVSALLLDNWSEARQAVNNAACSTPAWATSSRPSSNVALGFIFRIERPRKCRVSPLAATGAAGWQ